MVTRKGSRLYDSARPMRIVFGAYVPTDVGLGCPDWLYVMVLLLFLKLSRTIFLWNKIFLMKSWMREKPGGNDSPLYRLFTWFSYSLDVLKRLSS